MKTLIVAEKKSAAELFKVALERHGKFSQGDRCFESDKYIVTWVQGHVLSLKEPMDYDPTWKTDWKLQRLPWFPEQFEYRTNEKTVDIYKKVANYMKRTDVGMIINACDAAREGELIFWEPYDFNKIKTPVKRFFESAVMTPENINRIIDHDLKDETFFESRKDAAYARAYADLLLGMNLTIGFSVVGKTVLHMGRVQTPTLAILVQRELEIANFVVDKYYEIEANFGKYKGMWFKDKLSNTRIPKKEDAESIVSKINGKIGTVTKKDVVAKEEPHPILYNLAGLQKEANKKLGFTLQKTLEVAQALYDEHKILSYPRTDSSVIGTDHVKNLPTILTAIAVGEYKSFSDDILAKGIKTTKRMVNNAGLSDHHAIIPTEVAPNLSKLSPDEKALYDIVVRRFLSAFYPPAVYEKTEVVTEVEGETFKTSGSILTDQGWKVVYGGETSEDEEEDDKKKKKQPSTKEVRLPIINHGESNPVTESKELAKETKPPKRYTEGDLADAMENVGKFLEDDELRDIVKKAGLGTSATRDSVVDSLVKRGYIERKGKLMIPTELGIKLIEICPDHLKSPQVTAEWEQKLREIELGNYDVDTFMTEIKQSISHTVQTLPNIKLEFSFRDLREGAVVIGKCPICGSDVVERGKVFSCAKNTQDNPCFVIFKVMAGKKITTTNAKQLLDKKETAAIDGFVSKAGKKFSAKLVIGEDNKISFSFDTATPAKEISLKCPKCGGAMVEKEKVFACVNDSREKPCFSLFKTVGGKKITQTILKQLLDKKETSTIEGFAAKSGKKFAAKLILNGDYKVEYGFDNGPKSSAPSAPPQQVDIKCPICGSDITDKGMLFSCATSTREKPCLTVFKTIAGKTIDAAILTELIQNGRTEKLTGFKSKAGKEFSASLVWDSNKKSVNFEF